MNKSKLLKFSSLIVASLIFYLPVGYAKVLTASQLLSHCQAKPDKSKTSKHNMRQGMRFTFCAGYIHGVVDGYTFTKDLSKKHCNIEKSCMPHEIACIPKAGVKVGQLVKAYVQFAQEDSKVESKTARQEILMTINKKYPCKS